MRCFTRRGRRRLEGAWEHELRARQRRGHEGRKKHNRRKVSQLESRPDEMPRHVTTLDGTVALSGFRRKYARSFLDSAWIFRLGLANYSPMQQFHAIQLLICGPVLLVPPVCDVARRPYLAVSIPNASAALLTKDKESAGIARTPLLSRRWRHSLWRRWLHCRW